MLTIAADGMLERDSLFLLARARLGLGVTLGTLLPTARTLHGNELRKAGRTGAAVAHLHRATSAADTSDTRATAYGMLARAAGDAGDADLFDHAIARYRIELDRSDHTGMLTNEHTFREIHLRGLTTTGRAAAAARLLNQPGPAASPAAPQWVVIDRITTGQVLLAVDERDGASYALLIGLRGAEAAHLPHQAQRAVQLAAAARLHSVTEVGHTVLGRLLSSEMSRTDTDHPSPGPVATGRAGSLLQADHDPA